MQEYEAEEAAALERGEVQPYIEGDESSDEDESDSEGEDWWHWAPRMLQDVW